MIVWLGDIFDHPRPTYRSFRVAQRALTQDPRARRPGRRHQRQPRHAPPARHRQPYSALADTFPEMHFAHRLQYERFELPGLVVHAVPQMLTVEATVEALDEADRAPQPRPHQPAPHPPPHHAGRARATPTSTRSRSTPARCASDLVLLGHYHFHDEVAEGIWYAGSTDTFTFADDPDERQGHRRARHRHRRVPPRAARGPAPARHPRDGLRARAVARRGAGRRSCERAATVARGRGGPPATSTASTPRPTACSTSRPCARRGAARPAPEARAQLRRRAAHDRAARPRRRCRPGGSATSTSRTSPASTATASPSLGRDYLARAVEEAAWLTCSSPACTCATTGSTRTSSTSRSRRAWSASTAPTAPASPT